MSRKPILQADATAMNPKRPQRRVRRNPNKNGLRVVAGRGWVA